MPPTRMLSLETPLRDVLGVGSARAAQLAKLHLITVGDLLLHRPRRYEDRRHVLAIHDLQPGKAATTRGRIVVQGIKRYRRGGKSLFEFVLDDGTSRLHCRWWNLPFMEQYFHVGDEVMVYGKPRDLKPRTMDHPETEVLEPGEEPSIHLDRIAPIYPLTEGLPQRWLRSLIWRMLDQYRGALKEPWPQLSLAPLPARPEAIQQLHFPRELANAEQARRRLALDEFIELQVAIQRRRRNLETMASGIPCAGDNRMIKPFLRDLGFRLTEAQTKVLRELRQDLGGAHPMRRLLQGDVGSGKTVVAACCALMTIESGYDVALMAPTEILAEQHFAIFCGWFGALGVAVELQTGSRRMVSDVNTARDSGATRPLESSLSSAVASRRVGSPAPRLVVGTHALIEAGFNPEKLGLVIIDEQHKFGVAQRETLVRKGRYPHLLVMTATPIPRSLGLTIYGDLDVSVIDQLPAGRGRVRTFIRSPAQLPKVHEFIRQKLMEGRQVFIVLPRVEESDTAAGIKAVVEERAKLEAAFAPFRLGLLHGRLSGDEKGRVMAGFRAGEIQILLATSVVEVGVDVANATVMLIENADQFGLAQLHQLRGRIGRGAHESYCIALAQPKSSEAKDRLRVFASTEDGFEIAEADLRLRGAGELLGRQQSGAPLFRFGDLAEDRALVEQARELAKPLVQAG